MDEGLRKDRYEKRQVKTREPERSHKVSSPMGEDDQHHGHLTHGRGQPAPRSPRPWARMTITKVTSPMGEDDQHRGHLAHGRGRPAPGATANQVKPYIDLLVIELTIQDIDVARVLVDTRW
ncbi:hypothetical protein F2Q69_00012389 [Brassica cretica]|uniref:Uncharacterized protein n=1 Tax=Brassica cretica TaxID=69181 RepID=A0A8S9QT20_BRACR|nr:hypothetical protein F2Q69_00012389 [Brassica cretica]